MKTRWLLLLLVCPLPAVAADWPQWQGPERTNVSKEAGLLKTWPKNGPPLLWTFDKAGIGYSSPAVVGDVMYAMGARDGKETVYAIDTTKGTEIWATPYGQQFKNGYGDGPRGTPTVDGDHLYVIGGQGDIVCLEKAKGKIVWQKNMKKDLGGEMMSGWGYSESPLIDGDRLICTPGGGRGTFAALDKKTGNEIWRSKDLTDKAAYSSIIACEVGGVRMYVNLTGKGSAGVAAKDGQLLWQHTNAGYRTAVVPTPIFANDHIYTTADYGAGCDLLKLTPDGQKFKAEAIYSGNKTMANHHGGVVLVGDHIYGYNGNSNSRGRWTCQDLKSGKPVWEEERKLDAGSLTCADGQLYLYGQRDGTCVLVEATPTGWKENGRFKIPKETQVPRQRGKIWTHPVVANGKLFLRDEDLIFCYDIRAASAKAP